MADHFHNPAHAKLKPSPSSTFVLWQTILSVPPALLVTIFLAPVLVIIITRLTTGRPSRTLGGGKERTIRRLPYGIPWVGHGIDILRDPDGLMKSASNESDGIFGLNLGGNAHTVVYEPALIKSVLSRRQSELEFHTSAWDFVSKFFGLTDKSKYDKVWAELISQLKYLMREPELFTMLNPTIRLLQANIPQMISFTDSEIDLQPWEKSSNATLISPEEVEADLMVLMRDMLCHASIPAMFGKGLLEKYPRIIDDLFTIDEGLVYFVLGLPAVTPWPGVFKAHMARRRLWEAMDEQQRQLDKKAKGEETDYSWGDLDDVSQMILERNKLWRENNFAIKERGDLSLLWALTVNAPSLTAFHLLNILSTPTLLSRLREEINPHIIVTPPTKIGNFSSPPTLEISHHGLAHNCPLFKSTYLETLRLSSTPWSVRSVAEDVTISRGPGGDEYRLRKGESVIIPHELHMRDSKCFSSPDQFIADRFIISTEKEGEYSLEQGLMRPFGGGGSMCKGRVYAERECLALVAGVVMLWDIEPVVSGRGRKEWKMPGMERATGVMRPKGETRVRVKRRVI